MQRIFQAFVVLAPLVLSPALAQSRPATLPTQAAVVLPIGVELSDEELAEVEGKIFWGIVGGAAAGAISGALTEMSRQAFSGQKEDWREIGKAALWGAVAGGAIGVVNLVTGGAVSFTSAVAGGAVGSIIAGAGRGLSENPNTKPVPVQWR